MNNREPIILSRFQDAGSRVRDAEMRRHYRISLALVAVLLAATLGTIVTMTTSRSESGDVVMLSPRAPAL